MTGDKTNIEKLVDFISEHDEDGKLFELVLPFITIYFSENGGAKKMNQNVMTAAPVSMRCDFTMIAEGTGMEGFGIRAGDEIYIRQQNTATHGDIVVIVEGDELRLCRYQQSNGLDVFEAADPAIPSIIEPPATGSRIMGKAVGMTRYFELEVDEP